MSKTSCRDYQFSIIYIFFNYRTNIYKTKSSLWEEVTVALNVSNAFTLIYNKSITHSDILKNFKLEFNLLKKTETSAQIVLPISGIYLVLCTDHDFSWPI